MNLRPGFNLRKHKDDIAICYLRDFTTIIVVNNPQHKSYKQEIKVEVNFSIEDYLLLGEDSVLACGIAGEVSLVNYKSGKQTGEGNLNFKLNFDPNEMLRFVKKIGDDEKYVIFCTCRIGKFYRLFVYKHE